MSYTPSCDRCYAKAEWIEYRTFQYFYCRICKVELDSIGRHIKALNYGPQEQHDILVMNGWKYDKDPFHETVKYFHPLTNNYYSLREAWDEYKQERKWL